MRAERLQTDAWIGLVRSARLYDKSAGCAHQAHDLDDERVRTWMEAAEAPQSASRHQPDVPGLDMLESDPA
jgi:hypothetical protein